MKRLIHCFAALLVVTQLSSCGVIGSLLKTLGKTPGTVLNGVMGLAEAEGEVGPALSDDDALPGAPEPQAMDELVIVPSPLVETK